MNRSSLRRPIFRFVLLLASVSVAGCGSHDFLQKFPADTKLENRVDTQIMKAAHFTFDRASVPVTHDRADTGKVTVTFGDAEEQFEVPGSFKFTEIKNTTSPAAKLTITYAATEEQKAKYRELVKRFTAKAKPGEKVSLPDELPGTQVFQVDLKRPDAEKKLELTDQSGAVIVLERPKGK